MNTEVECDICIIGAGPSGLGAAYEINKNTNLKIIVIDKNEVVGGLSRTISFEGCKFDIGPHRFFTKNIEISNLYSSILKHDLVEVNRFTRIYYKNRYFSYPIKIQEILMKIGIFDSFKVILSYLQAYTNKKTEISNFEDWVIHNFGSKLYNLFFKLYTEKIWGIPCNEISKEWAVQRIKGLSLKEIFINIFRINSSKPKSLINKFEYPKYGAGFFYKKIQNILVNNGVKFYLEKEIYQIDINESNNVSFVFASDEDNGQLKISARHFFSSIPITNMFKFCDKLDKPQFSEALKRINYRSHISVQLILEGNSHFQDQWIYVHDPNLEFSRISNFNNFSKHMVDNQKYTAICVEYYVTYNDETWNMSDSVLIKKTFSNLNSIKLFRKFNLISGFIVREQYAYPIFTKGYEKSLVVLKSALNNYKNLSLLGRNGLFKYDNQDHAIESGFRSARNYLNNEKFNVETINSKDEYLESD